MVPDMFRHHLKFNRKVDSVHQMFILKGIRANIGPSKSFRMFKEIAGNYEDVGCSSLDFKNFNRDRKTFSEGVDAQMLLNSFKWKSENCNGFTFYYDVHEDRTLSRLFWSDAISRKNFQNFGDVVSFDATYSTNRYKMIFTSFTGKDNHGKCVTFGAAIISCEDTNAYSWVLSKFVECMGTHPHMIIIDQDPTLKIVIANVLPNTKHRFCMWHIFKKVAEKLPVALRENIEFSSQFKSVVWSDLHEPHAFKQKWVQISEKIGLAGHKWFVAMYETRTFWIPTYFRDVHMSGLMRTTSLFESENSFFRWFLNGDSNLVDLYMHYGIAMEAQRNTYDILSLSDHTRFPYMVTKIDFERLAAMMYTNKIFAKVQVEIVAAEKYCVMKEMVWDDRKRLFEVDDGTDNDTNVFKVCHNVSADDLSCSCKLFIRKGRLCKHIFFIMKTLKMKRIPEKYLVHRWMKTFSGGDNRLFAELCKSIAFVEENVELTERLYSYLKALTLKNSKESVSGESSKGNQNVFENFYDMQIPDMLDVLPPPVSKTKGSGVGGKRLKSTREEALEKANKPKTKCHKSGEIGFHDSRTCTNVVTVVQ